MTRYTVNASILLTDLPLLERPAAVREAGFDAVEFWWPWQTPTPSDSEIDDFVAAITDAGVELTGLNFFAGDMPGGERGVVSDPSRRSQFRDNVEVTVGIGARLGCRSFNALYGLTNDSFSAGESSQVAIENLTLAARAADSIDGIVLLEPVSGADRYPLKTADDVLDVIDSLDGVDNVKLLADFYHLAVNGDDVASVVAQNAREFGHIQIADAPGRGAPGTGDLPLQQWITDAQQLGYRGPIGLEYKAETGDPFAWITAGN